MENPKCPECGHQYTDDQIWHNSDNCEFPTELDGDDCELVCPSCYCHKWVTLILHPEWEFTEVDD